MIKVLTKLSLVITCLLIAATTFAQPGATRPVDSTRRNGPGLGAGNTGPKPYKEVITSKAISDGGLFWVHKVDYIYYFEIPDS